MYKAVIFDRDGVLLDSEYTNIKAGELAFSELGITITEDEKKSIVGRHPAEYALPILEKYHLPHEEFTPLQRNYYYKILKETPIFEKTIQMLKDMYARGLTLALCTSSSKAGTLDLLEGIGIRGLFKEIVTKEDYSKRKPDPEPYLVTAKKLGNEPSECLVIEDSEVGLKSALNAGMNCVIIYNQYTKDHNFSGAKLVVDSADKIDLDKLFI